jgi:hypothetical protein
VPLLNDLYTKEWRLFHNFLCPSVKLISKKESPLKPSNNTTLPKQPAKESWIQLTSMNLFKLTLSKQLEKLNPFLL